MKALTLSLGIFISSLTFAQTEGDANVFLQSYTQEQYKNYTKAIEILKASYNANSYEYNLRLAWLSYLNMDYLVSQNYYDKAIGLQPNSIEARLGKTYPLAALNNLVALEELYKSILAIDPNHSVSNYRLAYLSLTSKKYAEAETYLNTVLNLYPFDYESLVLMGKVKASLGKLTEAKTYYTKALLYNPSNTELKAELKKLL